MCGILAVIGKQDKELVAQLSARMKHRGPDERDVQVCNIGTLSHERLAIVDIHTGRQPIQGTRQTWVVHNGEIYNHKDLYETFLPNCKPRSTSDSEVIVHLWEKKGDDFCADLDGMFAFVVIDEDQKTFIAARDGIGVKPLYWGKDADGAMWFASEMKALADKCLSFEAFPPGHFYTPEKGLTKFHMPKWETTEAADERVAGMKELLIESVRKRLMCDVPFGVLLSGGLDSSLIASIVARELRGTGKKLHSFSIGLTPNAPDLVAARKVAEFLGTEHHEVYFSVEEGVKNAENLIWHLESFDVTTLRASTPMYFLTKYIREKGFKMVLSGEGADEVLGGYLYFFNAPSDAAFQEETKRRVRLLHTADVLRADKSTMANGIEVREPMLDKALLDKQIGLAPHLKRPRKPSLGDEGQMEKYVLRKAFDDKDDPYLPDSVLWRQKEQFSDGVGYSWIDGFKAHCESMVTDEEMAEAETLFPYKTPTTKEAFFIRRAFHRFFPQQSAAECVVPWVPKWQHNTDPSGRANDIHEKTTELVLA